MVPTERISRLTLESSRLTLESYEGIALCHPRIRLDVGTSAVGYLQAAGDVLGVAMVDTVVNNLLAVEFPKRILAQAQSATQNPGAFGATNGRHSAPPLLRSQSVNELLQANIVWVQP